MSAKKPLSHMSFAAIALLISALPALAQTESAKNKASQHTSGGIEAIQIASLTSQRLNVHRNSVTTVKVNRKQSAFSLDKFMAAGSQSSTSDSFAWQTAGVPQPKMTGSDDNELASRNRITFVPSKGQKLPCQQ